MKKIISEIIGINKEALEEPRSHFSEMEPRILLDAAISVTLDQALPDDFQATESVSDQGEKDQSSQSDVPSVEQALLTWNQPVTNHFQDEHDAKEVLVIDSRVEDYQSIIANLQSSMTIIVLENDLDGIKQIADTLSNQEGIEAIHIISHGGAGNLALGNSELTLNVLDDYSDELSVIGKALSPEGDILLYGCNVAQGEDGQAFISELAAATSADVAASDDITGISGDWELEQQAGLIESVSPLSYAFLNSYQANLAVDLTSASSPDWTVVMEGDNFDPGNDQQAVAAIDLAGFGTLPLMYTQFDDNSTPVDDTDDELAFRIRADNAADNKGELSGYIWMGIDVDLDNDIDVFAMLNGNKGTNTLTLYQAGTGAQTSPSTTALDSGSGVVISTNFDLDFSLTPTIDPSLTADGDADSDPDYYISFHVDFKSFADQINNFSLTGQNTPISGIDSGAGFSKDTVTQYVIASAQNANVLNGDMGGYTTGDDLSQAFSIKGAFSPAQSFSLENLPPKITSDGGSSSAAIGALEGDLSITTVTATDPDGDTVKYGIQEVADWALFSIDETTGALTLNSPQGAGEYNVIVKAFDVDGTDTPRGSFDSQSITLTVTADTTAPTISNVSSTTADGSYKVGDTIDITVQFDETVTVTGTPQLTLETGTTDRVVDLSSASGDTLTFTYTVQSGDTSADLDYLSTTALALNGGTIKDGAGNDANLTLAAPAATNSLGDNKEIVIDTAAPVAPTVTAQTVNSAQPVLTGGYDSSDAAGGLSVSVDGTTYTLGTDAALSVSGNNWSLNLATAGQSLADGSYDVTVTATDAAGNATNDGSINELTIDTTAPTISNVSSTTADGSYKVGDTIDITVQFDEAVTVTGTPQLTLETGTTDRVVDLSSASGDTLTFTYTVQSGDTSADLDYLSTTALALNGGTIKDGAGNDANLTLAAPAATNSLGDNKAIVIDTAAPVAPTVTAQTANSAQPVITGGYDSSDAAGGLTVSIDGTTYTLGTDGALSVSGNNWSLNLATAGQSLVDGSYDVTVTATDAAGNAANDSSSNELLIDTTAPAVPTITAQTANSAQPVLTGGYDSSDAAGGLTVSIDGTTYTLGTDAALTSSGDAWSLNLATAGQSLADGSYDVTVTATDAAGNAANDGSINELTIDTTAPTISNVSSTTADGSYKVGDTIDITVQFDEAVTVTGTPQLTLETGTTDRVVDLSSASGDTLTFTYTVQSGDTSADLDYLSTTALALNGGTIKDGAGNDANLTLAAPAATNSLGDNKAIVIDTAAPVAPTVTAQTANSAQPVITGGYDSTDAAGGLTVSIDGTTYTLGTDAALSVSGNNWSLNLATAGQSLADGSYDVTVTATDGAGNAANDSSSNELLIDTTAPAVPTITAQTANSAQPVLTGGYDSSDAAGGLTVSIDGTTYTLGTDAALSVSGNNWSLNLATAGQSLADGSYDVTVTATDAAGNATNDGSINELTIDTTAPTISNVSSTTADGSYKVGDTIDITVQFDEAVTVTGTPQLTLETGTTDRVVDLSSASGDTLTFTYTVQSGDTSADLDYLSTTALALNGGTIKDGAGNDANLTLAAPAATNSLGDNKAIVIDTAAPVAPTVTAQTANSAQPVITGGYDSTDAAGGLSVSVDGTTYTLGTDAALSVSGNNWSLNLATAGQSLVDGSYDVTVTATDGAGNAANDSSSNELLIDTTAPAVPTITAQTANSAQPVITGGYDSSDAAGGLTVSIDGTTYTLGTDAALTSSGDAWSLNLATAGQSLADGSYDVTVTATDGAGNDASDVTPLELVVDTTPPALTITTGTPTSDTTPVISGVSDLPVASVITVVIDPDNNPSTANDITYQAIVAGDGSWSVDTGSDTPLSGVMPGGGLTGTVAVSASGEDSAGNVGQTQLSLEIDTDAPAIAVTAANTSPGGDITISGSSDLAAGELITIVLDPDDNPATNNDVVYEVVAGADGSWSLDTAVDDPVSGTEPAGGYPDGTYDLSVTATDGVGNSAVLTYPVTVDTTAPTVPTVTAQTANSAQPVLTGGYDSTDAAGGLTVSIDGTTYTLGTDAALSVSGNNWSLNLATAGQSLADGSYDVTVTATDAAGNAANDSSSNELLIDTTAPAVPTITAQTANSAQPVITGGYDSSDAAGGLTVSIDGTTYTLGTDAALTSSGDAWSLNLATAGQSLADGSYDVTVTATDGAGNDASDVTPLELVVDTTPPALTITTGTPTSDTTPVISGVSDLPVASVITVVIDPDNNPSTANDITYQAIVAGDGSWSVDTGSDTPLSGVMPGGGLTGTVAVSASGEDSAGNVGQTQLSLEIDTDAPAIAVTAANTSPGGDITISGSSDLAAGELITIVLDPDDNPATNNDVVYEVVAGADGSWSLDTAVDDPVSGTEPAGGYPDGTYDLSVTATDGVGNSAVLTYPVTVDTTAPTVPTVTAQTANSAQPVLTGGYDSTDAAGGLTVSIDGTTYTLGTDAALSVSGNNWSLNLATAGQSLADGSYDVTVTATDGAGNTANDSSSNELLIDTTAPAVPTITAQTANSAQPVITGGYDSSDAAGGLTVSIDGTTYTLGTDAALSVSGNNWSLNLATAGQSLADGSYDVTVTATDAAGNATNDGSINELTIDTTAPTISNVSSTTADGSYKVGDTIDITVQFDEAVTVTGTPQLTLETGTTDRVVDLSSASGDTLTFTYTVQSGDTSADLDYLSTTALALNGGTIKDGAGNDANLTLAAPAATNSLGDNKEIVIDTAAPVAPTVTAQTANSAQPVITGGYDSTDAAGGLSVSVDGTTYTLGTDAALSVSGNNWSLNLATAGQSLADGSYDVTVAATDAAGNDASDVTSQELVIGQPLTVQSNVNPAPVIVQPTEDLEEGTISSLFELSNYDDLFAQNAIFGLDGNQPNWLETTLTLDGGIQDQFFESKGSFDFQIPENAFYFKSIYYNEDLRYEATLIDGSKLPYWLSFDEDTATFSGNPPSDLTIVLEIKVIAYDNSGNEATAEFLLHLKADSVNEDKNENVAEAENDKDNKLDGDDDNLPEKTKVLNIGNDSGKPSLLSQFATYGEAEQLQKRQDLLNQLSRLSV